MKNDSQSINDVLISYFKCAMSEKNVSYRVLAHEMKCSEKTVFSYLTDKKTKTNIPYSVAVVIYLVLTQNQVFTNAEERENLQKEIDRGFYSAFRQAFDLSGKNYLKLEAEYGISHSTAYCYYTMKKAPLLNSAYKVSQLLNFELPYIADIINQQIK